MRNYIYSIALLAVILVVAGACKKEAALTPSTGNIGYVLPQGNNSYDTTILNYYKKYGCYLLYKFTGKDTYWTPTGWKNAYTDTASVAHTGYVAQQATEAYVSKQLSLINKLWFSYYSDKFLKDFLPAKIMLSSTVDSGYIGFVSTPTFHTVLLTKAVAAWYNYDNICVNNARAVIDSMSARDSITYLGKVNLVFMQSIAGRNLANPTSDFASATNYAATVSSTAAQYAAGILFIYYNGPTAAKDWGMYMQAMVSTSETRLNKSTVATDATFSGILNATKDVNGVIRKRYNIIRNYFINTYNVDLQAIGNAADQ